MNTFTRRTLLAVGVAGVLGLGALGAQAYASNASGSYPPIVQKLVQRFGLSEADVQQVFDQDRQDRTAQMEAKFTAHLDQLVKDGKLTEAQKTSIIAKRAELQSQQAAFMASLKTMTSQQRQDAIKKMRDDLAAWAQANGIDVHQLMGGLMIGGRGHGFGLGHMLGAMHGMGK